MILNGFWKLSAGVIAGIAADPFYDRPFAMAPEMRPLFPDDDSKP